ncbi:hypothetical protein [Photobacterium damselae]|uniref:hypothetical protein n=1 Tax=Photobacterium damselae TaxID=38293 RepID=UPI001F3B449F|nr:hypothetical protein [Photobacterium damselae]UKA00785.1 hypothetical protein IHC89_08710 [Photobacterium damselae subsp. damselae]
MQISRRTKFSLAQLLGVIESSAVYVIFEKFNLEPILASSVKGISSEIQHANKDMLLNLIFEVIQTNQSLRHHTSPKKHFFSND